MFCLWFQLSNLSSSSTIYLKFIHKVRDHKQKAKFNFRFYHFFCSGVMPLLTLPGRGGICVLGHIHPFFLILLLFGKFHTKKVLAVFECAFKSSRLNKRSGIMQTLFSKFDMGGGGSGDKKGNVFKSRTKLSLKIYCKCSHKLLFLFVKKKCNYCLFCLVVFFKNIILL